MGFDLHGLKPQENTKKPEILIKYPSGWEIEDETIKKEWYNAIDKWENENPGIYFRNNVWYWRPLWAFVCNNCSDILTIKDMEKGSYNDGYKISKTKSKKIAARLRRLLREQEVQLQYKEFEEERQRGVEHNKKIEDLVSALKERVKEQHGDIIPANYPEPHKTDWDNLQSQRNWNANYPFEVQNVKEFAEFCEQSGGFIIC